MRMNRACFSATATNDPESQLAGGKSLVLIFAEFECFEWASRAQNATQWING